MSEEARVVYRLDNGLTVILEENRAAPVVALQAWVQVGSADETDREAGLAHLHEHMLFKGTAKRGPGEIARDIESRGGEVNAWTSFDQTVYHLTIASAFYKEGLEILSDQVLASVFDPEELAREIEVVLEEIKRANDMPARKASREMFDLMYRQHTYRRPVIGYPETVRSFTRDDVLAFYRKHYTPDNITLVAVGDFDAAEIRAQIETLWGGAQGKHGGRPERGREEAPAGPRARLLREAVQESRLALAWSIPDIFSEDLAALDLAAAILGHGESARLVQEIKEEKGLCNEVYAYAYTPKDPGLFVVGASLHHEKLEEATPAILRALRRLREEGCGEKELEVAKHLVESQAIWQRETVQGMARKLGFYQTVTGSLDFERAYYERIRATTAAQVQAACRRYLSPERVGVIVLAPEEAAIDEGALLRLAAEGETGSVPAWASPTAPQRGPSADTSARSAAAKGAVQRREELGAGIVRATLSSGATVLVRREPNVPVVAVRTAQVGGLLHETPENNGIHRMLARLLTKGSQRRSAREMAAATDELGAHISAQAGRNSFGLRGDFLAKHFEPGFRLLAECANEPAFDPKEVERERELQLEEIRSRDDNPAGVAFRLFAQALYPTHPYRLDMLGEASVLHRLDPEALRRSAGRSFGSEGMVLGIAGDVEVDGALALAEELFGATRGQRAEAPSLPRPEAPREALRFEKEMDKEQAHLIVGFLGVDFRDPRRRALEVLASVLAGQGGRLFTELRDKRSMAYSVTAFSLEGLAPGYFGVYMGTSPEKLQAAEAGIREELEKVVQEAVSEDELLRAQRHLIGSHAIGLQKNAARAAVITLDEAYGLGATRFTRYREEVEAVRREEVLEAARQIIDYERSVTALVTPA